MTGIRKFILYKGCFGLTVLMAFMLSSSFSEAQTKGKLTGIVSSKNEKKVLSFCSVVVKGTDRAMQTNHKGQFVFKDLPFGTYKIIFHYMGYESETHQVKIGKTTENLNVELSLANNQLDDVLILNKDNSVGGMKLMKDIDEVTISAGKKNEVILIQKLMANKATNQSRQIYAKIPGLNIWESDGAGLQLGIGVRGLDPSRTSNFNTRQNGYDISADALGYPESYYTPPAEAIKEIQLIRGAAALQFGTQFGGLLNFKLHDGPNTPGHEIMFRQTLGSFSLSNTFLNYGFNGGGWKINSYIQYKKGNEWRPNSDYEYITGAISISKKIGQKAIAKVEYTKMYYLAHQPGGLTDKEFYDTPEISKRTRNWFEVDWNLFATSLNYNFTSKSRLKTQFFGLVASRNALGILGNISRPDNLNEERDLISGQFKNFGNETRFVHIYDVNDKSWAFLLGGRYYQGYNLSQQGSADTTNLANFKFNVPEAGDGSSYEFPSRNISLFTENIIKVNDKLSITPGIRFEYISTNSDGRYYESVRDLAGNLIDDTTKYVNMSNNRAFVIGGVGINYKQSKNTQYYTNFTQNYRSVNFSDMQIKNENFMIDPNLSDETGYNFDIGVRGQIANLFRYDISGFALLYDNRIGSVSVLNDQGIPSRLRTNVSKAFIKGIEAMGEIDIWRLLVKDTRDISVRTFLNMAYTDARYTDSDKPAYKDKKVENVSPFTLKTGLACHYNRLSASLQYSYVHQHFTDAENSGLDENGEVIYIPNAIVGIVPSYQVMDLSLKYELGRFALETGINNLLNESYFTRRATGYPGPGIIPASIRNYYLTLQVEL